MEESLIQKNQILSGSLYQQIEMFPSNSRQRIKQQVFYNTTQIQIELKNYLKLDYQEWRLNKVYPAFDDSFVLYQRQFKMNYSQRLIHMQKDGTMQSYIQINGFSTFYLFSDWEVLIYQHPTQNSICFKLWNIKANKLTVILQLQAKQCQHYFIFPNKRLLCINKCEGYIQQFTYYLYSQLNQTIEKVKQHKIQLSNLYKNCLFKQINNDDGLVLYVEYQKKQSQAIICSLNALRIYRLPSFIKIPDYQYRIQLIAQVNKRILFLQFKIYQVIPRRNQIKAPLVYQMLWNFQQEKWSDSFPLNSQINLHFLRFFRQQQAFDHLIAYNLKHSIFVDSQKIEILGQNTKCKYSGEVANPTYDQTTFSYLDYNIKGSVNQNDKLKVKFIQFNKLSIVYAFILHQYISDIDEDLLRQVQDILEV